MIIWYSFIDVIQQFYSVDDYPLLLMCFRCEMLVIIGANTFIEEKFLVNRVLNNTYETKTVTSYN